MKTFKKKKCHYCNKEGHFRRDCRKLLHDRKEKDGKSQQKVNQAASSGSQDAFCFNTGAICFDASKEKSNRDLWYFDSGATAHMTNNADFFEAMDSSVHDNVYLADGNKILSKGVGTGKLKVADQNGEPLTVTLKDVLYVPTLAGNLLSISKITEQGFSVSFEKNGCKIKRNDDAFIDGERAGNLYHLKQSHRLLLVKKGVHLHNENCQHLWHRRFGHRSPDAVQKIVRENLGHNLNLFDCEMRINCEVCCQGKMSRLPFPKESNSKSCNVLDLVHTYVCGPMHTQTPSGAVYVMTMIDDYSRYTVVYILKRKSEAADKIIEYVNLVNNQFGRKPKIIRSDGGGEYVILKS